MEKEGEERHSPGNVRRRIAFIRQLRANAEQVLLISRTAGTVCGDDEGDIRGQRRDERSDKAALAVPINADLVGVDIVASLKQMDGGKGISRQVVKVGLPPISGGGATSALIVTERRDARPCELVGPEPVCTPSALRAAPLVEDDCRMSPRCEGDAERPDKSYIAVFEPYLFHFVGKGRGLNAFQGKRPFGLAISKLARDRVLFKFTVESDLPTQNVVDLRGRIGYGIERILEASLRGAGKAAGSTAAPALEIEGHRQYCVLLDHNACPAASERIRRSELSGRERSRNKERQQHNGRDCQDFCDQGSAPHRSPLSFCFSYSDAIIRTPQCRIDIFAFSIAFLNKAVMRCVVDDL